MSYFCIGVSVVLMFFVGSLSLVYTRGTALLTEIQLVAASQPDRRFGQLERQLLIAQEQLFPNKHGVRRRSARAAPGNSSTAAIVNVAALDELAQEPSYVTLHELLDLNKRILSLDARVAVYLDELNYPMPGAKWLAVKLGLASAQGVGESVTSSTMMPFLCAQRQKDGNGVTIPAQGTPSSCSAWTWTRCSIRPASITLPSCRRRCHPSPNGRSGSRNRIEPYGMWILPCLYAALGSMIFHMRLFLGAAEVKLEFSRVAHSVALAALAGMIVAWFWEPAFGRDADFVGAGFGLFTFAFIVGFSIDVFFALLDRLVAISTGAVNRLGANG